MRSAVGACGSSHLIPFLQAKQRAIFLSWNVDAPIRVDANLPLPFLQTATAFQYPSNLLLVACRLKHLIPFCGARTLIAYHAQGIFFSLTIHFGSLLMSCPASHLRVRIASLMSALIVGAVFRVLAYHSVPFRA